MKQGYDYDYFQEGKRFFRCEDTNKFNDRNKSWHFVEPAKESDTSILNFEADQIKGRYCQPFDEFAEEMNLTSFIKLLENLFDKIPEIVHSDYAQVVHFCKCFDIQEMERRWGSFSCISDDTPIDKSSSVLNTLCRVFYCGMDFLPMSVYDDNMRVASLPYGLVDCIFTDINPRCDLFLALELLAEVRCRYASERRIWYDDIVNDSMWCCRSTLTGELLDNDVYGED